jgi:hypothetical protein
LPPCQRFTFLQTCSTIENADSITLVFQRSNPNQTSILRIKL